MAEIIESTNQRIPTMGKVDSALTLGIIGTALSGLNTIGGVGALTGAFGNNANNKSCINEEELFLERKMAVDELANQKEFYEGKLSNLRELTDAFFQSYQRDVDNSFQLYQYSRNSKDELAAKIAELDKKVDVMSAIRPYQDALIDNKINTNALISEFNLFRRTCRMIEGQLVLPSTPTVTGYGSYNPFISAETSSSSNS